MSIITQKEKKNRNNLRVIRHFNALFGVSFVQLVTLMKLQLSPPTRASGRIIKILIVSDDHKHH